jgi:hypothetical protein
VKKITEEELFKKQTNPVNEISRCNEGEMTQTLYAHMNKIKIKKKKDVMTSTFRRKDNKKNFSETEIYSTSSVNWPNNLRLDVMTAKIIK